MHKIPGIFRNSDDIRSFSAGQTIFEEGSVGEEMFGVVEGEVEIRTASGVVVTLGPDDAFGELALVDQVPRSATAVAVADTRLAVINRSTFLFLVHETPMFALQVMSNIAERLRARG